MYLSSSLSFSLFFCWSGHVFSSLWSNVWKVKSLKYRSLKVFFKCICHCICHCLCLRHCLFVGQVVFSHHPDKMSQRSKVSKITLWRYSLNVIVLSLSLHLSLSLSLSFCWSGHVSSWPPSVLRGSGLLWKAGRLWIHNNQWNNDWLINQGRPRASRAAKKTVLLIKMFHLEPTAIFSPNTPSACRTLHTDPRLYFTWEYQYIPKCTKSNHNKQS